MKTAIQHNNYNTKLEASDWRFSAAILGLIEYFIYYDIHYKVEDDYILYNSEDITEDRYLMFVEYKYGKEFHHKVVEDILANDEISDEQVKIINDKLKANAVMKKYFSNIKFDNTNSEYILDTIQKNKMELIRETYGKKDGGYKSYIKIDMKQPVKILDNKKSYCRLNGYACADESRKSMALGFNFNKNSYLIQDELEFDFIPFAFLGDREAFFVNDNYSIKMLQQTKYEFSRNVIKSIDSKSGKLDARQALFKGIAETAKFINRDVEVIFKDIDKGYFETLYLRKDSIDVFKNLLGNKVDYKSFCFSYKVTDKYYRNIQKEVTECIINKRFLDDLIELFLKDNNGYLVSQFIKINVLMRGDKEMDDKLKGAFACAKSVVKKFEENKSENKIDSYRQKLTSSIIFKDYDRVCQILLQLSNYSGIEFKFVYPLYENFEDNKDLAYTFINALTNGSENKSKNNNESN